MAIKLRKNYAPILLIANCVILCVFVGLLKISEEEEMISPHWNNFAYSGSEVCGSFPCLGDSLCSAFYGNLLRVKSHIKPRKDGYWTIYESKMWDKYHSPKYKNCTVHVMERDLEDMPMRLRGHNSFRDLVCNAFNLLGDCDVSNIFRRWKLLENVNVTKGVLRANLIRSLSPQLSCASQRLVNRIVRRSASTHNGYVTLEHIGFSNRASLLLKLKMAPKIWLSEAFPSNEGWPFSMNYGSCGRMTVMKTWGTTNFLEFFNFPSERRVDLSVQLLERVFQLSGNDHGYVFSLANMRLTDMASNDAGSLIFERVDRLKVMDSKVTDTERSEIHKMDPSCTKFQISSNIKLACYILKGNGGVPGLLHDLEESPKLVRHVSQLLGKCVDGMNQEKDYFNAGKEILRMLQKIQPCTAEIKYRYPECTYSNPNV